MCGKVDFFGNEYRKISNFGLMLDQILKKQFLERHCPIRKHQAYFCPACPAPSNFYLPPWTLYEVRDLFWLLTKDNDLVFLRLRTSWLFFHFAQLLKFKNRASNFRSGQVHQRFPKEILSLNRRDISE